MKKALILLTLVTLSLGSLAPLAQAKEKDSDGEGKHTISSSSSSNKHGDEKEDSGTNPPKGLEHAPGIVKKLESGERFPFGLFKKWFAWFQNHNGGTTTSSTTPETHPLNITGIDVTKSTSSATISFKTNVPTQIKVTYGVGTLGTTSSTVEDTTLSPNHTVTLSALSPQTEYSYTLTATDALGQTKTTDVRTLKTRALPTGDTTAPHFGQISVEKSTSTATIHFTTDESATSTLRFGTSTSALSLVHISDSATLDHTVTLTNLSPDTTYSYIVSAQDNAGNVRETNIRTFKTQAIDVADLQAPEIVFATTYMLKATSTHIVFVTNKQANASLWISTTSPVDTTSGPVASSSSFSTYHNLILENLATSTQYYYSIKTVDSHGNATVQPNQSFTTLTQ